MQWSFSFSLYFVNGEYLSDWDAADHASPPVVEIDDCGPANLVSPGFAMWLVLVSAIACVVQLPGSVYLFRRSNFYRFSPEMGIVDAIVVLILVVKGIGQGYRWYECASAVITVRRGIGQGDLWWRKDIEHLTRPVEHVEPGLDSTSGNQTSAPATDPEVALAPVGDGTDTADEGHPPNIDESENADPSDDRLETFLRMKLAPTLAPLSQERVLGAALAAVAIFKVIVVLSTTSNNGLRLTGYLALAYTASYLFFEALTWSILTSPHKSALATIPAENLLTLIRLVDPGDNPSTFPGREDKNQVTEVFNMATLNVVNAVASLSAPSSSSATVATADDTTVTAVIPAKKWSRPVAATVLSLSLLGPLFWTVILSNIWSPARGAWILCVGAVSFLLIRAASKFLFRYPFFRRFDVDANNQSTLHTRLPVVARSLLWFWHRSTTVNLYSAIWLGVIAYYYIKVFPAVIDQENGGATAVQKPKWLDWLG